MGLALWDWDYGVGSWDYGIGIMGLAMGHLWGSVTFGVIITSVIIEEMW